MLINKMARGVLDEDTIQKAKEKTKVSTLKKQEDLTKLLNLETLKFEQKRYK